MIDVFRVGIHLGMTTNSSQVIATMVRELGVLGGSVDSIVGKMQKFGTAIAAGVAVFAGAEALRGMWDMVHAAEELNKELNRTQQLGGEFAATIAQTRQVAFATSQAVPTSTASENVRLQRELATQLQHQDAANDILPTAQRIAYVISNYTGERAEEIARNLTRVADVRAQIFDRGPDGKEHVNQERLLTELNAAARGLILSGGFMRSSDMLTMARQSGVPAKLETPEAFYAAMTEMAISQGAARTGTATTSMFAQLVGGTMTRRVAEEMQRVGLLQQGEWSAQRGGAIVVQEEARNRLQQQVGSDPIAYIMNTLGPMMDRLGMSQMDKLNEVFALFGRQTTQRLVAEALSAGPQFERARQMFGSIPDPNAQYDMLRQQDLGTNIRALQASWTTFMQALGEGGIPIVITMLQNLTTALQAMTQWAVAHPETAHAVELVAAALAGLAVLGGSLVLISLAIGAVSTALGALVSVGTGALATTTLAITGLATGLGALTAATASIASVVAGLTALGGAIGAIYGILRLGSSSFTPESQRQQEELQRQRRQRSPLELMQPQDGYDTDGRPIPRSPSATPSSPARDERPVQLRGDLNIDGRKMGEFFGQSIGSALNNSPRTGSTGADLRTSPFAVVPP